MDATNLFAQLQALSTLTDDNNTIAKSRKQLREIVDIFHAREDHDMEVRIFAEKGRNLSYETLVDSEGFMVQPDTPVALLPEELRHDSLGFCRGSSFIFDGRFVYPVKDVKGDIMGFCGYDMFETPKYLDSFNYGYKAKAYSVWGMEKLPVYYRNNEPVFFVEGIVCALYLRQEGLQSLALLGSNASPYVIEIIRRFGMRAVVVCDSDDAGTKCKKMLQRRIPGLRCIQSRVAKDIDDSREVNPDFVNELRKFKNPFYRSELLK